MREFVLVAPSRALSDEPGTLTRFLTGALLLSHGVRPDARALIFFDGKNCVSFNGGSMRNVRPDEQSLSGILRAGLKKIRNAGGGRVMQGIHARAKPFEEYASESKGTRFYYGGRGGKTAAFSTDFVAIFQHPWMGGDAEEELARRGFMSLRLCERMVLPDQAAILLNNRVDRNAPRNTLSKVNFQD